MLALKSAAALLAAVVLVVIAPSLLIQDAGPGKADDVAQLLPENTLAFVELVKAPRLLHDWKEYVGSVTTAAGKDKACKLIEEWFEKTIEIVPEKILKDLKEGLPSIQRMAVALTGTPDPEIPWVFIATSSDAAFFKKLVETDLAVFAAEEKAHNGVKVLAIRKMGDLKSDHPVYVAAPGQRLVVTTRWASMTDALDRAAGRGPATDLRKNRLYAQLAPAPSDDPALRAFSRWDWDALMMMESSRGYGYGSRRSSRYEMDQADAVFSFKKFVGTIVEATFKPGKVASTMRIAIDSPCRLYDAFRQPPGPKDLLAALPKGTALFFHQNLKGGKEVWADVEAFIKRYQEIEERGRGGLADAVAGRAVEEDWLEEMDRESKEELGYTPREIAALVGNEIVLAFVEPEDAGHFEQSILLLARATDAAKAKEMMEKIADKTGYTSTTEDKATVFKSDSPGNPCFGIRDTVVAFGLKDTVVKEALKAKENAAGVFKLLPKDAATASAVVALNPTALTDMFLKMVGTEKPEPLTFMKPDDWSVMLGRMEKDHVSLTSMDSGYGALLQTAFSAVPLVMVVGLRMMWMGMPEAMEAEGRPAPKAGPEPPALPADALAKRTAELVAKLRSDDLEVRDKASNDLQALGRQAIPLLVAAYKEEKDAEARSRLTTLLVEHKAWDALPELLDKKVAAFFEEFRAAVEEIEEEDDWSGYSSWMDPDSPGSYSLEPYVRAEFLARFKNGDVLSIPDGMKRFAAMLKKADIAAPKRPQFAAVLAFNDCGTAHETVLEMRDVAADAESRAYLTAALGWSDDAKAKEAVYKSLESKELAVRRGAFLAAERARDPEMVARLLDRTKDKDLETRWNAGFTLGVLTSGKMDLNAFLPDAEFEVQVKAAREWWVANKATFKPKR